MSTYPRDQCTTPLTSTKRKWDETADGNTDPYPRRSKNVFEDQTLQHAGTWSRNWYPQFMAAASRADDENHTGTRTLHSTAAVMEARDLHGPFLSVTTVHDAGEMSGNDPPDGQVRSSQATSTGWSSLLLPTLEEQAQEDGLSADLTDRIHRVSLEGGQDSSSKDVSKAATVDPLSHVSSDFDRMSLTLSEDTASKDVIPRPPSIASYRTNASRASWLSVGELFGNASGKISIPTSIRLSISSSSRTIGSFRSEMAAPFLTSMDEELRNARGRLVTGLQKRRLALRTSSQLRADLVESIRAGNLSRFELILGTGRVDVDATLLFEAVCHGRDAMVALLLKMPPYRTNPAGTLDYLDESGMTAFDKAMELGNEAIIETFIVIAGADVNATGSDGLTPLARAVCQGNEAIVQLLLNNGAAVDSLEPNETWRPGHRNVFTPLQKAAELGNETIARLLLQNGATVDKAGRLGQTPLFSAASEGHVAVARVLLEGGANQSSTNPLDRTALHAAASHGHISVVELLLEWDAPLYLKDKIGRTALHLAAEWGHIGVAELLLERDPPLDLKDKIGETALHRAAEWGHIRVAELLLEKGASAGQSNAAGQTPLHIASRRGVRS
ncbi:hypothetical protein H2203_008120 [Taxawa tesnikishii (nom. ined.)]|nr:hypothetical protein H2203_008120 [Dothideales sp. JES 119]